MIVRIVKLTFKIEHIASFKQLFIKNMNTIRASKGCIYLELLQDENDPTVFFTHSHWDSSLALEAYRNSEFFLKTWEQTKAYFSDKPMAWSLESIHKI
jgi:quinol monooxygenase YgiN